MGFSGLRNDLRYEEGRNEKGMLGQFDHPHGSVLVVTRNAQLFALDLIFEGFIQAVIAREHFRCLILAIDPMRLTAGNDLYVSGLPDERAGESTD